MPRAGSGSKNSNRLDPLSTPESSANNLASEDATAKAFKDVVQPVLDLMKSEIVASQMATAVQLKESFLRQILQLNETISEYTTRVATLEEKLAALQKEMKETKMASKPTNATTVPKPTYATVTGNNLPERPPALNTTSKPVNNQSMSKGYQEKAKKE
jgi:uncharacterized coiled-coil protein SlyX